MSSNSKIEWTEKTWNPVTGCTKVSQGCKNCYAETFYERFNGPGSFKNVQCHADRLAIPLKWKKPSMIFVNSMSDLFHEDVPFTFINAVFSVMSDCDHHIYQILTKRQDRMLQFYEWKRDEFGVPWQPKKNVWIGVSVEDQANADLRIPVLLQCPARIQFLSCEPLLGPLDLRKYLESSMINWVIVGGESGQKARPMHPKWPADILSQCEPFGIPFFFKQWGTWAPHPHPPVRGKNTGAGLFVGLNGKPMSQGDWWDGTAIAMDRVGKNKSGRMLLGKEYSEFPLGLTKKNTHYEL